MTAGSGRIRALCFDFDGVIVDSSRLKVDAFVALYSDRDPATIESIRAYCDYHGGMSRQRKIDHIQDIILHEPMGRAEKDALAERFRSLVLDKVLAAPMIPGAKAFLDSRSHGYTCFVVSGTPHEEITAICEQRRLASYFRGIGGAPTEKAEWIARFLKENGIQPSEAIMIGDAPTDYDAANQAGTHFIGVGSRPESLMPVTEPLIPDLTGLAERIQEIDQSGV